MRNVLTPPILEDWKCFDRLSRERNLYSKGIANRNLFTKNEWDWDGISYRTESCPSFY